MSIRQQLIDGKSKIGVWGCGYIGFTTMINFAKEGIYSIGYDVSESVIKKIRSGGLHIPNIDYWIGYHIGDLVNNMMEVTTEWVDMMAEDIGVHFIAVPTEKDGEPYFEPLQDVMTKISTGIVEPTLIIIESTLTPGMFDKVVIGTLEKHGWSVGEDVMVGISPRRDWFDAPEKNLKALNRVVGGTNAGTTQVMKEVLSIVCDHLELTTSDIAELVKSVENSIFHLCAVYACQLSEAYPDVNITEVLRLASTHWRIPLYFPSVGTGGYCIPVSSKYVLGGAEQPKSLTLAEKAIEYDKNRPVTIADMITSNNIGILGISYKRDLKVHVLSPALKIVERLKELGKNAKLYDPYYTGQEIESILGIETFQYPDGLSEFDSIIVVSPHRLFGQTPKLQLFNSLKKGQTILDNEGIWNKWREDFIAQGVNYHRVGDKGWQNL